MPDLFISYARADSREFVARLSAALETRGKDTWVDLDDIPAASSWNEELRAGIAASDSFCFVISPASVASPNCRAEIDHAVALGKRILPVLHLKPDDAEVPAAIGSRNWIPQLGRFLDDFDANLDTLVDAAETDLDWLREHTRWGLRAEEWERRNEDRSLLARGSDLTQAETFIGSGAGREPAPTELQGRYVVASRQSATRRQRQLFAGVSVALVVSLLLGVLALLQRNTAIDQRHEAERQRAQATSRALAADAFLNLPTDPELSLLLGLDAAKAAPTAQAESALRSGLLDDRLRETLRGDGAVYQATYSPDGSLVATAGDQGATLWTADGHKVADLGDGSSPVLDVTWSSDGSRLVTRSDDGIARVWDGRTGGAVSSMTAANPHELTDVVISPTGNLVVTAEFGGSPVTVWNATDGSSLGTIRARGVDQMAMSPDGSLLLLAVEGKGVQLWGMKDGRLREEFRQDEQATYSAAAFSPDGSSFATAGSDGRTVARSISGALVATVQPGAPAVGLAFTTGGDRLVIAAEDGTAEVTDLGDGSTVATYHGAGVSFTSVAVSPDGSLVATGAADGSIAVWSAQTGALLETLAGHRDRVESVAFSSDGAQLLSASMDGTTRAWAASLSGGAFGPEPAVRLGDGVDGVFSDDGALAAFTGAFDATTSQTPLFVVDTSTGRVHQGFLLGSGEQVLALSRDGTLAVTTGSDAAELRRVADGSVVARLAVAGPRGAAFDATGSRVAVTGADGAAAVFDARRGKRLLTLHGHASGTAVTSVAFNGAGSEIVTAGEDTTARIWNARTGALIRTLQAYRPVPDGNDPGTSVAFSPDGTRVVTAGVFENTATLWDPRTGDAVAVLNGLFGGDMDVAFSSSGRFLVTAERGGGVRLWDGRDGRLLTLATQTGGPPIGASVDPSERHLDVLVTQDEGASHPSGLDRYTCDVCGDLDSLVALARTRVTRALTATEKSTYLSGD